ncbi:MAG: ABC transporter ATP-binding protein [Planctomycetes bacterium]|nr:ABC transporter ATP-binding protein [Planctomycetota bacterium]
MPAQIEVQGVGKEYPMPGGSVYALSDVSLTLEAGEFVSIVGSSGSGKSTFLYLLGFMIRPTSGTYRFHGQPVQDLSDVEQARLRGKEIGFVFQSFHLIPQLNVVKNVMLGARYLANGDARAQERTARTLLERVGLSHRLRHRPFELSNGEMQRVAVARALLGNPSLILADEPTGNLDENTGNEIFNLLAALNREGKTVVVVTHNRAIAERTPRTITLKNGRVSA